MNITISLVIVFYVSTYSAAAATINLACMQATPYSAMLWNPLMLKTTLLRLNDTPIVFPFISINVAMTRYHDQKMFTFMGEGASAGSVLLPWDYPLIEDLLRDATS